MAKTYTTPGVYIEEIPKLPPSIAAVETAIPAFIGYTKDAMDKVAGDLHLKPKRITSMVEYVTYFGGPQPEENIVVTIAEEKDEANKVTGYKTSAEIGERSLYRMYYALQLFYSNGGGPCWIVSVGTYNNNFPGSLDVSELGSPAAEDTGLGVIAKVDEPTLLVFPDGQGLSHTDYGDLCELALQQCELLKDRFVIMDVNGGDAHDLNDDTTNLLDAAEVFRGEIGTNNLKYGAAYAPNIETSLDYAFDETKTNVKSPTGDKMLDTLKAKDNKFYELAKAAIRDLGCKLAPSGAIAGIYASTDETRGVWKAPANVSINLVTRPTIACSAELNGTLNVDSTAGKSINIIRFFTGKGTLVWGARTLAGNDNEWRYINVRRFFNMVEESTKKAVDAFTFEPNDANTWVRVQGMIENFLTTQWRQGALQGIKPEHAFYVAVGLGKTMTALDILEGRMIVEIGMAVVRPAEFIVLQFSHMMAES